MRQAEKAGSFKKQGTELLKMRNKFAATRAMQPKNNRKDDSKKPMT
jgi:hypothetical protein